MYLPGARIHSGDAIGYANGTILAAISSAFDDYVASLTAESSGLELRVYSPKLDSSWNLATYHVNGIYATQRRRAIH